MKKTHATLLILLSVTLIIDVHFTHIIASFGNDFPLLPILLGCSSYQTLVVAVLFGFVFPSWIGKAERNPLNIVIEENALTVNEVRSTATFSAADCLICQPSVFENTLRQAVNTAISPSLLTIKPMAKVTVLLGTRHWLKEHDTLYLNSILRDMFINVEMRWQFQPNC